jgi:ribosomal protein S21
LKGVFFLFMVFVRKQPGDSDDAVIRKFVRKVIDAGIIPEAKRRQFYLKPSLAKKVKQEEARRNKKRLA